MASLTSIDFGKLDNKILGVTKHLEKIADSLSETFRKFVEEIKEVPESSKFLAEYGWYLPFDFHPAVINRSVDELKSGNSDVIDKLIVEYFDDQIKGIQNSLLDKFPKRSKPINAAINAHIRKEYYLSIPVFFSQSEGICEELTNIRFFKIRKDQPATKKWVSKIEGDTILAAVLEPLKLKGKIRDKQDFENPTGINRHDVLHGNSVDYGDNKLNSYKALSLLNYLGETVYEAKMHLDRKQE